MSKPNNSISKIKLPGESTGRPIVPYAVGYSNSNTHAATLPLLTTDPNFVITTQAQEIGGDKTFTNWTTFMSGISMYDSYMDNYLSLGMDNMEFSWFHDWNEHAYRWYFNSNVPYFEYDDNDSIFLTYTFPSQSGTLGLQIDIVDLT